MKRSAVLALLLVWVQPAQAASGCPAHYLDGTPPAVVETALAEATAEICKSEYASFHSGVAAVPLWSAQSLSADAVRRAKLVDRVDAFHAEQSVPRGQRAELGHYRASGYDRGHLAPAADMATAEGQHESFSLANVFPQDPQLNRRLWAHVEATARGLALAYGHVYLVTGVAFTGGEVDRIGGRVLVPDAVYKAVWVPGAGAGAAWWSPNRAPGEEIETISLADLRERTGFDHFPGVPESAKLVGAVLPEPSPAADRAARNLVEARDGSEGR